MRRICAAVLFSALLAAVAIAEGVEDQPDCDPSLPPVFIETESQPHIVVGAHGPVQHLGTIPSGNPHNSQPFLSHSHNLDVPQAVDVVPPVTIIKQATPRPPCRANTGPNIKLKNDNAVTEVTLPLGADFRKVRDILDGVSSAGHGNGGQGGGHGSGAHGALSGSKHSEKASSDGHGSSHSSHSENPHASSLLGHHDDSLSSNSASHGRLASSDSFGSNGDSHHDGSRSKHHRGSSDRDHDRDDRDHDRDDRDHDRDRKHHDRDHSSHDSHHSDDSHSSHSGSGSGSSHSGSSHSSHSGSSHSSHSGSGSGSLHSNSGSGSTLSGSLHSLSGSGLSGSGSAHSGSVGSVLSGSGISQSAPLSGSNVASGSVIGTLSGSVLGTQSTPPQHLQLSSAQAAAASLAGSLTPAGSGSIANSLAGSGSVVGSSVMSTQPVSTTPLIDRRQFFLSQERLFKTSFHFRPGIDSFRLFDYAGPAQSADPANIGGFQSEWKNFPNAWANMTKTLNDLGIFLKKEKKIFLCISGFSASKYAGNVEHFALSERRAAAAACYLAAWFKEQGMPNFSFKIGFFGDKYASGHDPLALARDRRVDIFYALNTAAFNEFVPQFHWKSGTTIAAGGSDGGLHQYCKNAYAWKRNSFSDEWLRYAGPVSHPTNVPPGLSTGAAGSTSKSIPAEVFEDIVFGSSNNNVPASAGSISFSGSSSVAAPVVSSISQQPVLVSSNLLNGQAQGQMSVQQQVAPVAPALKTVAPVLQAMQPLPGIVVDHGTPSIVHPHPAHIPGHDGGHHEEHHDHHDHQSMFSDHHDGHHLAPNAGGRIQKLDGVNDATFQDPNIPYKPPLTRHGFVFPEDKPRKERGHTVIGSPITG